MRELISLQAHDGDNIIEHLAKFKQLWDRTSLICQSDLPLPFKDFVAYSLPPSWDNFTGQLARDPDKRDIDELEYIRECNEEYRTRIAYCNH